jgi:hypothetical protein
LAGPLLHSSSRLSSSWFGPELQDSVFGLGRGCSWLTWSQLFLRRDSPSLRSVGRWERVWDHQGALHASDCLEAAAPRWAQAHDGSAWAGVPSWGPLGHHPGPCLPSYPYPVSPCFPPSLVLAGELTAPTKLPGGCESVSTGPEGCSLGHLGGMEQGRGPQAHP